MSLAVFIVNCIIGVAIFCLVMNYHERKQCSYPFLRSLAWWYLIQLYAYTSFWPTPWNQR